MSAKPLVAEERRADLVLLESMVQRVTGRSAEEIRRQPLDEERRQVETRTGKRMRFTRNFPFIGRGCIMGDRAIEEIRQGAIAARQEDISSPPDDGAGGFTRWTEVYEQCQNFDKAFFWNEKVQWARSKQRMFTFRQLIFAVGTSVIAGILVALLFAR